MRERRVCECRRSDAIRGRSTDDESRVEGVEMGLMREIRVERRHVARRTQEHLRHLRMPGQLKGDPCAQEGRACPVEVIDRSGIGRREQIERRLGIARLVRGMRRIERPSSPGRRFRRQLRRAQQERSRGRVASARPGARRRSLQLTCDALVDPGRRLGGMPGATIGVGRRIGDGDQRCVSAASIRRVCRAVDGGPGEGCRKRTRVPSSISPADSAGAADSGSMPE
nr:hypothetical protein GCM10025699_17640 [Microbacterium flavescens]